MKISLAIVALLPLSSASVLRGYHTAIDENDDRKLQFYCNYKIIIIIIAI
jgi:hypothetical protein